MSSLNEINKKMFFGLNANFSCYKEHLSKHSIKPDSYFELKYNMYIFDNLSFNSLFGLPFNRNPILQFFDEKLNAFYFRFNGNQLNKVSEEILIFSDDYELIKDTNSNVFKFNDDFYIKVIFRPDTNNTGMCIYNKLYNEDITKSTEVKDKELLVLNNKLYNNSIEKLNLNNRNLNINLIQSWLNENSNLLNTAIDNTTCHKWKKWRKDNTLHIFPCLSNVCGTRNLECRYVEFYKLLIHYTKTIRPESFYKNQLNIYKDIEHNKKAVFEWIIDVKKYGEELLFIKKEMFFKDEKDKNLISFEMDKEKNKYLWQFKTLFQKYIYFLEFEEYEK